MLGNLHGYMVLDIDEANLVGLGSNGHFLSRGCRRRRVELFRILELVCSEGFFGAREVDSHNILPTADVVVIATSEESIEIEETPCKSPNTLATNNRASRIRVLPGKLKSDHQVRAGTEKLPTLCVSAGEVVVGDVEGIKRKTGFLQASYAAED